MFGVTQVLFTTFKTVGCLFSDDKPTCLANVAKDAVSEYAPGSLYSLSTTSVAGLGSLIYSCGKAMLSTTNRLANKGWTWIGKSGELGLQTKVRELTKIVSTKIEKAETHLLDYLAPGAASTAKSENHLPFKATALIGPTLLMWLCGKNTLIKIGEAFKSVKMLYNGKREETRVHITPTGIPFTWRTSYTASSLVKKSLLDMISASFWTGTGYLTAMGVRDAMIEGGINEPNQANMLTAALAIICIAPSVLQTIYKNIACEQKGDKQLVQSVPIMPIPKKTLAWDNETQQVIEINVNIGSKSPAAAEAA